MKNNLMNQTVKWEELSSLTDREMNQLSIKQDTVCQKIIRDLKSIEEFLNNFEDFGFERKLIVCLKIIIVNYVKYSEKIFLNMNLNVGKYSKLKAIKLNLELFVIDSFVIGLTTESKRVNYRTCYREI